MKFLSVIYRRLPWINLPGALLLALLQRTPVLQVAATAEEMAVASPVGVVLRCAVGTVASLGALHSLAGATTLATNSHPSPLNVTAGTAIPAVFFTTNGTESAPASWRIGGTIPPGLSFSGRTTPGTVNISTLQLSGTPTTANQYAVTLQAYEGPNLSLNASPVFTYVINVAGGAASAPTIGASPASTTSIVGGSATFTVGFGGSPTPTIQWSKDGAAIAGATSASLTLNNLTLNDAGNYTVTLTNSAGVATSAPATLTINPAPAAPMFTTPPGSQSVGVGGSVTFSVDVTGVPAPTFQWLKDGLGINNATGSTLTIANVQAGDAGSYAVTASNESGSATSASATLSVILEPGLPVFTAAPQSQAAAMGSVVALSAPSVGSPAPTFQWQLNGSNLAGATDSTLTLTSLQPMSAGIYTELSTNSFGTVTSDAAIVGVATTSEVIGAGTVLQPTHIKHPNGNFFDQILLTGVAETITAVPGQVARTSYIDLNDDIVQVEFAGSGALSLVLDNPTGPAVPVNYNQPAVSYMKGHAGIVIVGADETTNLSVFTVGRVTANDPTGAYNILFAPSATNNPANNGSSLFIGHTATVYDGVADIAFIAISSTNGKFGGLRASNANCFAAKGLTGIYAPGVAFDGPVFISDINASDAARPVLMIGSSFDTRITGGDLLQTNGQPVKVTGLAQLKFTAGGTSNNVALPAQRNKAVLQQNGADVTAQVVVNPAP